MKNNLFLLVLLMNVGHLFSQDPEKPRLITGPVIGAVTKNSVKLWIAYKGDGQNMLTLRDTVEKTTFYPTGFHKINGPRGITTITMDFTGLKPDHIYKPVFIDPLTIHPKCFVVTLSDTVVKDFDFLMGSCALLNTDFTRFALPGAGVRIFPAMKKQRSDFMVWLGDNVYYLNKQYSSYRNMFMRNLNIRTAFVELREFMAAIPNYAIWDDHDYGWNDSDKKFPLKDSSLSVFEGFWPNPYPDKADYKGNYFSYKYYDTQFFMTDDRYYRDPEGDTTGAYLGKEQLAWLKNELKNSDASFKFICTGSQVINDAYFGESYAKIPKERNELLDFIAKNNIKGVIFLTGDKHYSELSKRDWKGYTFYDFTSSPLTNFPIPLRYLKGMHNSYTIKSTILYKRNFGKVSVSGPPGDRTCKMEIYGNGGQKKWEYVVQSNELVTKVEKRTSISTKK